MQHSVSVLNPIVKTKIFITFLQFYISKETRGLQNITVEGSRFFVLYHKLIDNI